MADVPLQVISEQSASERRITPSWSISQLKAKLEPVTGIPPSAQKIFLKTPNQERLPVEGEDEDHTYLTSFNLVAYAELQVSCNELCFLSCPKTRCCVLVHPCGSPSVSPVGYGTVR